jgi:WD40 repeat protein
MGPWCGACHDSAKGGQPLVRPGVCRPVVFSGRTWVHDLAWGAGGRLLLAHSLYHPDVRVWDTVTGQVQKRTYGDKTKAIAVSPDGTTVAVCAGGEVRTWSLVDWRDRLTQSLHFDDPACDSAALTFSPDGKLLAVASLPYFSPTTRVMLVDSVTGRKQRTLSLRQRAQHWGPHPLAFSPDGKVLALACGRPLVRRWEVASGRELPALPDNPLGVSAIAWGPDGKSLVVAQDYWDPGRMQLWNVASRRVRWSLPGPVGAVAFSPDGRVLAAAGRDGCLRFCNPADGRIKGTYRWRQEDISAVAFSPDGQWLATAGWEKENRVKLWPVDALLRKRKKPARSASRPRIRPPT